MGSVNKAVGKLDCKHLGELLGEATIMESDRYVKGTGRWRYYLSTKIGPVHLNTHAAQELVLDKGRFAGSAEERADLDDKVIEDEPGFVPPEPAPAPAPKKSSSWLL